MRESGYYPPGAEFDTNAPYNQVEPPEREFTIEAAFDLHRTDELWSSNYGKNNAAKEWRKLHYTPLEIIRHCRALAEHMLANRDSKYPEHVLRHIIDECDGWEEEQDIYSIND